MISKFMKSPSRTTVRSGTHRRPQYRRVQRRCSTSSSSHITKPAGSAGQADRQGRKRPVDRTAWPLKNQLPIEDELECVLHAGPVHGERERVRRQVAAQLTYLWGFASRRSNRQRQNASHRVGNRIEACRLWLGRSRCTCPASTRGS